MHSLSLDRIKPIDLFIYLYQYQHSICSCDTQWLHCKSLSLDCLTHPSITTYLIKLSQSTPTTTSKYPRQRESYPR